MPKTHSPAAVFRSLADVTRARIALLVSERGELCVCDLTEALQESQPKVSRHLATMRAAGLLSDRRDGPWVHYRIHPAIPAWVWEVLAATRAGNADWIADAERRLPAARPRRANTCS